MKTRLLISIFVCLGLSNVSADISQFDFNGNLDATLGPATLDYAGETSGLVTFGTASSLGLPSLPGGIAGVISFPAFTPDRGLLVEPSTSGNGGGNWVNQYTLIYDLLISDVSSNWFSLYNTATTNSNDGDFFIRPDGGIGISGVYDGTIMSNQWHRIAIVWDVDSMYKYIDGALVGSQVGISSIDGRWSLSTTDYGEKTWLLTDDNGDTNTGYVSSFLFVNEVLDAATIQSFGGADANGIVPEPITLSLLAFGTLMLRKRK